MGTFQPTPCRKEKEGFVGRVIGRTWWKQDTVSQPVAMLQGELLGVLPPHLQTPASCSTSCWSQGVWMFSGVFIQVNKNGKRGEGVSGRVKERSLVNEPVRVLLLAGMSCIFLVLSLSFIQVARE
jgi:hypothetical protein